MTFWCVLFSFKNFEESRMDFWNPEIRVLEVAWLQLKSSKIQLGFNLVILEFLLWRWPGSISIPFKSS